MNRAGVNNDISGKQLTGRQYKLTQGNGKYSSERTKGIIGEEIPGMRQEIPKEGTGNCFGDAATRVRIKALEEHDTFVRIMKKVRTERRSVY